MANIRPTGDFFICDCGAASRLAEFIHHALDCSLHKQYPMEKKNPYGITSTQIGPVQRHEVLRRHRGYLFKYTKPRIRRPA